MEYKGLFSTDEERHAFVLGMAETACPWKPWREYKEGKAEFSPYFEYHYYLAGRCVGWPVAAIVVMGLVKLAFCIF